LRNISVDFDFDVNFDIEDGVDLAGARIQNEQQNTSLSDFFLAFKCTGLGTDEDTTALQPNAELSVCVKSVSPEEVEIDEIVSVVRL